VGFCGLEAVIESSQELGTVFGGDDVAGAPVGRVGAAFDQAGGLEVVEEVGHDGSVDAEVLGEGELAADSAVCRSGEHLITAGTAGEVSDCVVRGDDVRPEDRPEPPPQVVGQCVAAAADRQCSVSVLSDIGHEVMLPVGRTKISHEDVLCTR
jgi:hypothetical protein